MSVEGFLNRAVNNLKRAAKAKHREITECQAEITRAEQKMHKQINKLENDVRNQEADLAVYEKGSVEAANDIKKINDMKEQISQVQRDFNDKKAELEQLIKIGEDFQRAIDRKAEELRFLRG